MDSIDPEIARSNAAYRLETVLRHAELAISGRGPVSAADYKAIRRKLAIARAALENMCQYTTKYCSDCFTNRVFYRLVMDELSDQKESRAVKNKPQE